MHTMTTICALLFFLLFLLVSAGYYFTRDFIQRRELAKASTKFADIEVSKTFLPLPFPCG